MIIEILSAGLLTLTVNNDVAFQNVENNFNSNLVTVEIKDYLNTPTEDLAFIKSTRSTRSTRSIIEDTIYPVELNNGIITIPLVGVELWSTAARNESITHTVCLYNIKDNQVSNCMNVIETSKGIELFSEAANSYEY